MIINDNFKKENDYVRKWINTVNVNNSATYKPVFSLALIQCILEKGSKCVYYIDIKDVFINFVILFWISASYYKFRQNPITKDDRNGIDKLIIELIEDFKKNNALNFHDVIDNVPKIKKFITNEYNNNNPILRKIKKDIFDHGPYIYFGKNLNMKEKYVREILKEEKHHTSLMIKHNRNNESFAIEIDEEKYRIINSWRDVLVRESIYRWAELVETYNFYIIKSIDKLSSISNIKFKRNLEIFNKHKKILEKFYSSEKNDNEIKCFYEDINLENVSWDHYIPHSYMFNDDIWNLVPTSRSLNSRKSNNYSSLFFNEEFIKKLYQRNDKLYDWVIKNKKTFDKKKDIENIIDNYNFWKKIEKIKEIVKQFENYDRII